MNIIVSACLLGEKCRYDGNSNARDDVIALEEKHCVIPVCPERLGGLKTPRLPAERLGGRVVSKDGSDVTREFALGAEMTASIAKEHGCRYAVLKSRSPSCGSGKVYDGTFSGKLIPGDGVTAQALKDAGLVVLSDEDIEELKRLFEVR